MTYTYVQLTNAQKTTKVKKHYLAALYHSVFYDRDSTQIVGFSDAMNGAGVSTTEAQMLVKASMGLLRVHTDGSVSLSQTKTGSKVYGSNCTLWADHRIDGKTPVLSEVPRYNRNADPVDMNAVRDACMKYHRTWSLRKML